MKSIGLRARPARPSRRWILALAWDVEKWLRARIGAGARALPRIRTSQSAEINAPPLSPGCERGESLDDAFAVDDTQQSGTSGGGVSLPL
jgi:hypothetical protein